MCSLFYCQKPMLDLNIPCILKTNYKVICDGSWGKCTFMVKIITFGKLNLKLITHQPRAWLVMLIESTVAEHTFVYY